MLRISMTDAGVGGTRHYQVPEGSTVASACDVAEVNHTGKRYYVNGVSVNGSHLLVNGDNIIVSGIKAEAGVS